LRLKDFPDTASKITPPAANLGFVVRGHFVSQILSPSTAARLVPVRRLIFNADDFGLTAGINRSIVEAHTQGVLTSATLMANAPATVEGEELARTHPKLAVGCHVVLLDGEPLTDPSRLSSLVPNGTPKFRTSLGDFAARALYGSLDRDQIESEATAQFRKLQAAGLSLSHFDTHKHAHMFPSVLDAVLRAARICGIPAVRNPFEPAQTFSAILGQGRARWKRSSQTRALRLLQPGFSRLVKRSGLRTTDGTVAIAATGSLDAALLSRILKDLPNGTWEFVCHPGYCDDSLRSAHTRLLESREIELQLLTAPETRELLKDSGIHLISYADL
jgi:chitin disaccharide deacetylase